MTDDEGQGVIQLDGLWINQYGNLLGPEKAPAFNAVGDSRYASHVQGGSAEEAQRQVIEEISGPESRKATGTSTSDDEGDPSDEIPFQMAGKKILEIVTDSASYARHKSRSDGARSLLSGVTGWEYLLGEMFGVDHVDIGVDGMCLIQQCIGGSLQPAGIADVFFRRCYLWIFSMMNLIRCQGPAELAVL